MTFSISFNIYKHFSAQVDNAVDFVTIGGLNQIIRPSLLDNSDPEIAAKAAVLLGSAAQSNPTVQRAILEADLLSPLINLFSRKESEVCCLELKNRVVYAISCIGKENCYCYLHLYTSKYNQEQQIENGRILSDNKIFLQFEETRRVCKNSFLWMGLKK